MDELRDYPQTTLENIQNWIKDHAPTRHFGESAADVLTYIPGVSAANLLDRSHTRGEAPTSLESVGAAIGILPMAGRMLPRMGEALAGSEYEQALARAKSQGFDTSKTYYHGTAGDFDQFKTPGPDDRLHAYANDMEYPWTFATDSPKIASGYADSAAFSKGDDNAFKNREFSGANVRPVFIRPGITKHIDAGGQQYYHVMPLEFDVNGPDHDSLHFKNVVDSADEFDNTNPSNVVAVKDPRNIQSVFYHYMPTDDDITKSGLGMAKGALGGLKNLLQDETGSVPALGQAQMDRMVDVPWGGTGRGENVQGHVSVLKSPSYKELRDMAKADPFKAIKTIRHEESGDTYAWPASSPLLHAEAVNHTGNYPERLTAEDAGDQYTKGDFFLDRNKLISGRTSDIDPDNEDIEDYFIHDPKYFSKGSQ